jgi:DNA-binding response OmpR family regulator
VVQDATSFVWLSRHPDVQVLRWPQDESERSTHDHRACLWLVERGEAPPEAKSCTEDWLWLPTSDVEMQARLCALAMRAEQHPRLPELDDFGKLTFCGESLFLSPTDEQIVRVLINHFGEVTEEKELLAAGWPGGTTSQVLRVHISRLRRRLEPLGLKIQCVRSAGYSMAEAR